MDWSKVQRVAIYPAIGVARVGNSPDSYFLGPMVPGIEPSDPDDFRDSQSRIKRQASKFFVYALDENGRVVGEINHELGAQIHWSVEIANKKSGWYDFDIALDIPTALGEYDMDGNKTPDGLPVLSQRRNQDFQGEDREKLLIQPKPQQITGCDTNRDGGGYRFDDGEIDGTKVYLGELRTDEQGRLIFLGGLGHSASFNDKPLTTFANNQGWYDDTSDGPVNASVTLPDGRKMDAVGAWVLTAPPNYAVGIQANTSGFDLLTNLAVKVDPSLKKERPDFYVDIYPLLARLSLNQWVNAGMARDFGWGSAYDFSQTALLERAADPCDANLPFRQVILESFRNPNYETMEANAWPPLYGDAVTFNVASTDPRNWYAITELQYEYLQQWAAGDFCLATPPKPKPWAERSAQEQADGLTEAALEETLGGPFHPGCEFTWPMRHATMYRDDLPFRVKYRGDAPNDYGVAISTQVVFQPGGALHGSAPGDITRWMAVPWQTDTSSCLSAYRAYSGEYLPTFWPARVPNDVLTEAEHAILIDPKASKAEKVLAFSADQRKKWLRGYVYNERGQAIRIPNFGIKKFTADWGKIGIVVRKPLAKNAADQDLFPDEIWVETGRRATAEDLKVAAKSAAVLDEGDIYEDRPAWMEQNPRKWR